MRGFDGHNCAIAIGFAQRIAQPFWQHLHGGFVPFSSHICDSLAQHSVDKALIGTGLIGGGANRDQIIDHSMGWSAEPCDLDQTQTQNVQHFDSWQLGQMRPQSPIRPAHMAEGMGGQTLAAGPIFGR